MSKIFRNAPLWSAVLMLAYLIVKNWIGFEIPGWDEIYTHIVTILSIVFGE